MEEKKLITIDFAIGMDDKSKYNPLVHNRQSIRLKGYNYAQEGLYFITICCHERRCLFGEIINEKMILNEAGIIATQFWKEIPSHFPAITLHAYIVMPNHIHGIIELSDINPTNVGAENLQPGNHTPPDARVENLQPLQKINKQHQFQKMIPRSVSSVIKGYKIGVTKWIRKNTDVYIVWQRNYYEHIIRNEQSYRTISEYITNNPASWAQDKFYI